MKKLFFIFSFLSILLTGCDKNDPAPASSETKVTFKLLAHYGYDTSYLLNPYVNVSVDVNSLNFLFSIKVDKMKEITIKGDTAERILGKEAVIKIAPHLVWIDYKGDEQSVTYYISPGEEYKRTIQNTTKIIFYIKR